MNPNTPAAHTRSHDQDILMMNDPNGIHLSHDDENFAAGGGRPAAQMGVRYDVHADIDMSSGVDMHSMLTNADTRGATADEERRGSRGNNGDNTGDNNGGRRSIWLVILLALLLVSFSNLSIGYPAATAKTSNVNNVTRVHTTSEQHRKLAIKSDQTGEIRDTGTHTKPHVKVTYDSFNCTLTAENIHANSTAHCPLILQDIQIESKAVVLETSNPVADGHQGDSHIDNELILLPGGSQASPLLTSFAAKEGIGSSGGIGNGPSPAKTLNDGELDPSLEEELFDSDRR
jgi:hypothetical protein